MIELRNKDTSAPIGEITEEQLDFLVNMLEEEDSEDKDYWIDEMTLQYFQENGADPALIKLLQDAIGENEGIEIEWVSDEEEKEE
jgi:processive 1,2-diacylglycerol beta-glucosyltransferase